VITEVLSGAWQISPQLKPILKLISTNFADHKAETAVPTFWQQLSTIPASQAPLTLLTLLLDPTLVYQSMWMSEINARLLQSWK
jgi:hypothetical protein